uniref:Uncharacterized protein n=1 Tax=Trichogramma kaykai TaxID=54128 RepID=A0ABD2XG20_9HYME
MEIRPREHRCYHDRDDGSGGGMQRFRKNAPERREKRGQANFPRPRSARAAAAAYSGVSPSNSNIDSNSQGKRIAEGARFVSFRTSSTIYACAVAGSTTPWIEAVLRRRRRRRSPPLHTFSPRCQRPRESGLVVA